jgi:DNA-binding transcriptional regulator of glucitol operon
MTVRRRAVRHRSLLHLAVLVWVPVCGLACYWQVTVALAGDSLGWLYSGEWPLFGLFGIVVWWNLIHDDPETVGAAALRSGHGRERRSTGRDREATTRVTEETPDLEQYNDYLAALAANDRQKSWRR